MPNLRQRLTGKDRLNGVFLKTPAPHMVEISALAGCDFVSPDMEHAPLDLRHIDQMVGFAGWSGIPILPRLPSHDPALIGRLLDAGADGVLAPHVRSPEEAAAIVAAARFGRGARGFSPSPRAGGYGTLGTEPYLERQRDTVVVALQIEDGAGLGAIDAIARVDGVDALFIGPADLSMSLGVGIQGAEMGAAISRIRAAGQREGLACGIFVPSAAAAVRYAEAGFTWFILGSDQSHYLAALRREITEISS